MSQDLAPPLISRKRGRSKTTRVRKRERHQKKKTKCSNSWCKQEGHDKRSCRTANVNRALVERVDSSNKEEEEVIVVEVPIRRRHSRAQTDRIDIRSLISHI